MSIVNFNKTSTSSQALLQTSDDTIYFTTDNHHVILNGVDYTGDGTTYEDGNDISY